MATLSPTPTAAAGPFRRSSQRKAPRRPPSRPVLGQPAPPGAQQQPFPDDSSEDEIPVPMKLSALTKALLNDGAPEPADRPPSPPRTRPRAGQPVDRRHARPGSVHEAPSSGPASREASPVRKRVVRLSTTPQSLSQMQPSKRRSTSLSRRPPTRPPSCSGARDRPPAEERPASRQDQQQPPALPPARPDVNTPAHGERVVRIVTGSSGGGRVGSASGRSNAAADGSGLDGDYDAACASHGGSVSRYPSTRARADDNAAGNANPQSSMRVKRVGKIPGSFLSGPARRGRRRQSDDAEDNGHGEHGLSMAEPEHQPPAHAPEDGMRSSSSGNANFNSGSPVGGNAAARALLRRYASNADLEEPASARPSPRGIESERVRAPGQENEAPAGSKPANKGPRRPPSADVGRPAASLERKPLAAIAGNTPRRAPPPPPPPKMSVLDAATSTARAAAAAPTTQAKQRRNVLRVNGKCYTRLDCLGRGGSAKVYRVTAENGAMFALKRVSLDNADETTMRGYKGEIDLLRRLSGVDRVIQLFDHELNAEKQVLALLMEMGELDLNKLLTSRQNPEAARLDAVFVRFYWKEMLECLQAVHEHDIVHSDLKPANFVLVRGRLKLIDFGIANAIQTDQTVNVHRETQIGTPNYMSPESLIDANNPRGRGGRPRLMKLGKPSDVWSLGCILYQMVYGLPPFGHIANQMARCQAIVDWDHAIEFPARGLGGVAVPPPLLRTLRRCLSRDQHLRPTCAELLHETDPFLHPVDLDDGALPVDEELLARLVQSVVARCHERMPTEAESATVWPQAYWASIKATGGRV